MEENEECLRCGRTSNEVKLISAISGGELLKICEECAITEDIPIVRKPTAEQLKESEKPYSIKHRLSRMAGVQNNFKPALKISNYSKEISLDKLRKPKDYHSILEKRFSAAKSRNQPLNLIENFNWHITMARKKRQMTRKQLADVIGESETSLKLIEENFLPDDASRIINKIEQYFGMDLRAGHTNPEIIGPARILKFDPESVKNLTIEDLKKMKEAREQAGEKSDFVLDLTEKKDEEVAKESTIKKISGFFKGIFSSEKKTEDVAVNSNTGNPEDSNTKI